MSDKDTVFPQYRKLANGRTFYKIVDDRNFEEIQLIGTKKMFYRITATQYPEILKIQDMLDLFENVYLSSSESEWKHIENTEIR